MKTLDKIAREDKTGFMKWWGEVAGILNGTVGANPSYSRTKGSDTIGVNVPFGVIYIMPIRSGGALSVESWVDSETEEGHHGFKWRSKGLTPRKVAMDIQRKWGKHLWESTDEQRMGALMGVVLEESDNILFHAGLLNERQKRAATGSGGKRSRLGSFKVDAPLLKMMKDEGGHGPEMLLFKKTRDAIEAAPREELPAIFGADNIPDAQDVIARAPRKAFQMFLRNASKVHPKMGSYLRAVPDNAALVFYGIMLRISGRMMADEIFNRYFTSKDYYEPSQRVKMRDKRRRKASKMPSGSQPGLFPEGRELDEGIMKKHAGLYKAPDRGSSQGYVLVKRGSEGYLKKWAERQGLVFHGGHGLSGEKGYFEDPNTGSWYVLGTGNKRSPFAANEGQDSLGELLGELEEAKGKCGRKPRGSGVQDGKGPHGTGRGRGRMELEDQELGEAASPEQLHQAKMMIIKMLDQAVRKAIGGSVKGFTGDKGTGGTVSGRWVTKSKLGKHTMIVRIPPRMTEFSVSTYTEHKNANVKPKMLDETMVDMRKVWKGDRKYDWRPLTDLFKEEIATGGNRNVVSVEDEDNLGGLLGELRQDAGLEDLDEAARPKLIKGDTVPKDLAALWPLLRPLGIKRPKFTSKVEYQGSPHQYTQMSSALSTRKKPLSSKELWELKRAIQGWASSHGWSVDEGPRKMLGMQSIIYEKRQPKLPTHKVGHQARVYLQIGNWNHSKDGDPAKVTQRATVNAQYITR